MKGKQLQGNKLRGQGEMQVSDTGCVGGIL